MGRYAAYAQEILYSKDGKLKGFNAGYDFHAEHEFGYKGIEQLDNSRFKKITKRKIHLLEKLLQIQNGYI